MGKRKEPRGTLILTLKVRVMLPIPILLVVEGRGAQNVHRDTLQSLLKMVSIDLDLQGHFRQMLT